MLEYFGVIFDGWSHDSEHFIGVFACYEIDSAPYRPLLAMAPVVEPPDDSSDDVVIAHNAEAHRDALVLILRVFGKTIDQVVFLVSDNCSLNKRQARLLGVPFVGRLNLAMSILTAPLENVLCKIHSLIVRLRTLNQSTNIRFKTLLRPVIRQVTRWGSTFKMLKLYFELLEFIDRDDESLAEFIPSASENKKLKVLLATLGRVESVSMQLQSEGINYGMYELCSMRCSKTNPV